MSLRAGLITPAAVEASVRASNTRREQTSRKASAPVFGALLRRWVTFPLPQTWHKRDGAASANHMHDFILQKGAEARFSGRANANDPETDR